MTKTIKTDKNGRILLTDFSDLVDTDATVYYSLKKNKNGTSPMNENDLISIAGRIKNILAKEDIALSPVGNILVNSYTHVLKSIYDFSDNLPEPHNKALKNLLRSKEDLPKYVIKLSTSKEKYKTLYEECMEAESRFSSNEAALDFYTDEYNALGGDVFWLEAESSPFLNDDHRRIMRASRAIQMCKYLIEKGKNE